MRNAWWCVLFLACFGSMAWAQALVTTQVGTQMFATPLATFEIEAAREITVHRVGIGHHTSGPFTVEVWIRPDGIGATPPSSMPLNGWIHKGTSAGEAPLIGEIYQVPVDINHWLQANHKLGVCLVRLSGNIRSYSMPGQVAVLSNDLRISTQSYIGAYNETANPHFTIDAPTQYYGGPTSFFHGSVWYYSEPMLGVDVPSLDLGKTVVTSPGATATYSLETSFLSGPVNIAAPTGVEISAGAGYASSLQLSVPLEYTARPISVRIKADAALGQVSGTIILTGPGVPAVSIPVSGDMRHILAEPSTLFFGVSSIGAPGVAQSFTVAGGALPGPITVTAPPGFELATQVGGPYAASLVVGATTSPQTIYTRMTCLAYGLFQGSVLCTSGQWSDEVGVSGRVIPPGGLLLARHGPVNTAIVDSMHERVLLADFSLMTLDQGWSVSSIAFSASGTADEQTAISALELYTDHPFLGTQGSYDPGVDSPADIQPGINFDGPDGSYVADLASVAILPSSSSRFFLIATLAATATTGQTIQVEIDSIVANSSGSGETIGAPTSGWPPAAEIGPLRTLVDLNGPLTFTTVHNDSQGLASQGHVICDVTVSSRNGSMELTTLTFAETGSIDGLNGLNFLQLYLDDGDGRWSNPVIDVPATGAAANGFTGFNGFYQAVLTSQAGGTFSVNESRRYFLVAKLAGNASPGHTVRVSLEDVGHTAPIIAGVPTQQTSSLKITLATLAVTAGPANPGLIMRQAGKFGFSQVIGQFRVSSSLGELSIAAVALTTGGTGDWATHLDPTHGVCLYLDNGNGKVDDHDQLLFNGPGVQARMLCGFKQILTVQHGTHNDILVALRVRPGVSVGAETTFFAQVAGDEDIGVLPVGSNCMRSTPLPDTGILVVRNVGQIKLSPTLSPHKGGAPITITGQNFALPVAVTIGGVPCLGEAIVEGNGTSIIGLFVPQGSGRNLPIVLENSSDGPLYLNQSFTYSDGVAAHAASGNGCVGAAAPAVLALVGPAFLAVLALRRRSPWGKRPNVSSRSTL